METRQETSRAISQLRMVLEILNEMADPSGKENPALERAKTSVLERIAKELAGPKNPTGTFAPDRFLLNIKTPFKNHRSKLGLLVGSSSGVPLCSIESVYIPLCRTVRINGRWFRLCEDFDAKYQEEQFSKDPEDMDF